MKRRVQVVEDAKAQYSDSNCSQEDTVEQRKPNLSPVRGSSLASEPVSQGVFNAFHVWSSDNNARKGLEAIHKHDGY
jgi:hypothetical protein